MKLNHKQYKLNKQIKQVMNRLMELQSTLYDEDKQGLFFEILLLRDEQGKLDSLLREYQNKKQWGVK